MFYYIKNLFCFFLLLMTSPYKRKIENKPTNKRVLFIGIDGLRSDCFRKYAPNMRKFAEKNIYTLKSQIEIPLSSPSWATIYSGLSSNRTRITNNAFQGLNFKNEDNNLKNNKENTIFNYICEENKRKKSVMIYSGPWNGIHNIQL